MSDDYIRLGCHTQITGEIINAIATFSDDNGLAIEIARITDLNQILRAAYDESKKTVVQKSMVGL